MEHAIAYAEENNPQKKRNLAYHLLKKPTQKFAL